MKLTDRLGRYAFLAVVTVVGSGCNEIPGEAILRNARRVEVFRVGSEPASDATAKTIGGFPILAVGKEQGVDYAARLSKVLRSDGVTQNQKKCGLEPGVAFRLWSGDQAVEVLVCFKCDVLWPHVMGSRVENPHFEWQDFDPIRPELLALTKEAFPDDAEIRNLPERRK
jgi:hypothetical protein